MPTVPPGRYTRTQLCSQALTRVGNATLLADALIYLDQHLYDLYTQYDWSWLLTTATLTLSGPTVALPADFLQAEDDNAFRVRTVDGQVYSGSPRILELDRKQFDYFAATTQQSIPPIYWHVDRATDTGLVWPDPTGHTVIATLRYKFLPAVPADPANEIPAFPYATYLMKAVECWGLEHEKDVTRLQLERQERDGLFVQARRAGGPLRAQESGVPLDPMYFRTPFQGDGSGSF